MITLTKANITDYLKEHMPDLDYSRPLIISEIGEGTPEEDGDGYVNFVFRVSDGKRKMILKQGRSVGRSRKSISPTLLKRSTKSSPSIQSAKLHNRRKTLLLPR